MERPLDPFRSLEAIQEELNRLFGDDLGAGGAAGRWSPPVDIYEADDHYVLQAEVPGLTTETLEVQVTDNELHLKGERHPYLREVDQYHLLECPHGAFSRSFQFPVSLQASETQAKLSDGILTLYLPKKDVGAARKIRIG